MWPTAPLLEQARAAADGASGPATAKHVKRAYHAACLQLHPDRHVGSSAELRAMAEELFKVLTAAYEAETATSAQALQGEA